MSDTTDKKLRIILSQSDGWNFGLGFSAALLVFWSLVLPVAACALGSVLTVFN